MPSVSAKQHRLMAAVATNPAVAKKTKIPQSVGKEFMEADKGKKFKGGGEMKESKAMVKKEIGFMKKKGAPKSMIKHEMAEAGMKKGGVKKMALGGMGGMGGIRKVSNAAPPKGPSAMPAFAKPYAQSMMKQAQAAGPKQSMSDTFRKVGAAGAGAAKALMGKKAGGLAAGHKEADGIAKKGKTKAMQVKMAGGGKTKKYC